MQKNKGITLLETLAVLLIIGIMTAVSIPLLSGSKKNSTLKHSSTEIITMFKLTKNIAFTKNTAYSLIADLEKDTICIENSTDHQLAEKIWQAPNSINLYTSGSTTGKYTYTFSPRGTISACQKLYIEAANGECHTISIWPLLTGKINLYFQKT